MAESFLASVDQELTGGETKLSNLVTLCRFHHRQVHEGRVIVNSLDDSAFRFTRPDGKTFESPMPPATTWDELVANQQIQITPQTAIAAGAARRSTSITHSAG